MHRVSEQEGGGHLIGHQEQTPYCTGHTTENWRGEEFISEGAAQALTESLSIHLGLSFSKASFYAPTTIWADSNSLPTLSAHSIHPLFFSLKSAGDG